MTQPDESPDDPGVIRHGEARSPRYGYSERSTLEFIRQREAVYASLFGTNGVVHDDALTGLLPHIDVYAYRPGFGGRNFTTLVTGGMSDLRMSLPADAPPELPARAELVFYLPEGREVGDEHVGLLRTTGRFPYDYDTWLGGGHTIPNGTPPQPIFPGRPFDTLLLIGSIVHPDNTLPERLVLDGDPVHLLWVVPITAAEREYKRAHGTGALLDLFDRVRHPIGFDVDRPSYV